MAKHAMYIKFGKQENVFKMANYTDHKPFSMERHAGSPMTVVRSLGK